MTTEEKRKVLNVFCDNHDMCESCPLLIPELRCGRGEQFCMNGEARMPDRDVDLAYSIAFPDAEEKSGFQEAMEKIQECGIKDSGSRREFDTGAVRDIQEGKGRCDLMPLDVVAGLTGDIVIQHIYDFQSHGGDVLWLNKALQHFIVNYTNWCPGGYYCSQGVSTMCLEVSKHFEEGAKKYGEHNWQKGIPVKCYIDSAVRHYLKWLRGDTDEPHDRAFCWNILCCIWTCIHKPELNDYRKDGESDGNSST